MKFFLHKIITLFFLVFTLTGFSQSSKEIENNILDVWRSNPDKAIEYAKNLLSVAQNNKSHDTIAMAYMYMAKSGRVKGTYQQAIQYANLGIDFANKNDVSKGILAELYLAKANNLADAGVATESADVMFKGSEIAQKSGDTRAIAILNHGLGYTYYASKDYDKSITTLKNNLSFIEYNKLLDRKSFETYYKGMVMLSQVYLTRNQNDSALLYLEKGLKQVLTTDDYFTTSGFYSNIGNIYLDDKKYDKAYQNFLKSREYNEKVGNEFTRSTTDFAIANYFYEKREYKKCIEELNAIVDRYTSSNYVEGIPSKVYKLLADTYKIQGDLEKANENYEKYVMSYEDSQSKNEKLSKVIHNKELDALALEKDKQKQQTNYLLIGGLGVIGLLLASLLYIANKRKKEKVHFESLMSKINTSEKQVEKSTVIDTKDIVLENSATSDVSEETVQEILDGLQKLEVQEYYLKQECNSHNVAKKIKTNTSYLSKVVNSHYQKNFNTYINDLRINYTILRLKNDSQFRSYTIQSIANEVGYKSADSFTKYFKKHTGLNPSFYIKKLNSLA